MKKLTGWAAIIAVPYPGFGKTAGFFASTVVIFLLMTVLYVTFRRRDWL